MDRSAPLGLPGHATARGSGPSARAVLVADSAWDALLGAALLIATVSSATRPLGAGALRPWPLPVALGAVCLAASAFLLYASTQAGAASVCRSISPGNAAATIAGIVLLLLFPGTAHAYVVAVAVASIGCAVFAVLEWTASG